LTSPCGIAENLRFPAQEMLEVRMNQAHLMEQGFAFHALFASSFNSWDSVRDLFTISRIAAFIETCDVRPVRSIRPE
jgi:hypothetical protein